MGSSRCPFRPLGSPSTRTSANERAGNSLHQGKIQGIFAAFANELALRLRARRHDHIQTLRRLLPMCRAFPGACMSELDVPQRVEITPTPTEAGIVNGGFLPT